MKSKDQLAQERYGYCYDYCCWREQLRIDGMFAAQAQLNNGKPGGK